MARLWYGGTFADLVISQGAEAEIYVAEPSPPMEVPSGAFGTAALLPLIATPLNAYFNAGLTVQTTDLLDAVNTAITQVLPEEDFETRGTIPRFQGPDGHEGSLWLSADGEVGYRLEPEVDLLYDRVAPIETDITAVEGDIDAIEASVISLDTRVDALEVPNIDFQVFEADGTWTKPAGAKRVFVECQGAGGAGGGCATTGASQGAEGAGGGGGGYGAKWFDASSLAATVAVVVGEGGTGNAGAGGNAGEASSFGAHFAGAGGGGGGGMVATAGPLWAVGGEGGGVTDLGTGLPQIIENGGDGANGIVLVGPGYPIRQNCGGSSRQAGRQFKGVTGSGNGTNGGFDGAGGSGAVNGASQGVARTGGSGGPGEVRVTTFFY